MYSLSRSKFLVPIAVFSILLNATCNLFIATAAQADTFAFSYTYKSGKILSGRVDGDLQADKDTIKNLRNLNAQYSGLPEIKYRFVTDFDEKQAIPSGVVSFSGTKMSMFGTAFKNPGKGEGFLFLRGYYKRALVGASDRSSVGCFVLVNHEEEDFSPVRWTLRRLR